MEYSIIIKIIMPKNASDMLIFENRWLNIIGSVVPVLLKIPAKP